MTQFALGFHVSLQVTYFIQLPLSLRLYKALWFIAIFGGNLSPHNFFQSNQQNSWGELKLRRYKWSEFFRRLTTNTKRLVESFSDSRFYSLGILPGVISPNADIRMVSMERTELVQQPMQPNQVSLILLEVWLNLNVFIYDSWRSSFFESIGTLIDPGVTSVTQQSNFMSFPNWNHSQTQLFLCVSINGSIIKFPVDVIGIEYDFTLKAHPLHCLHFLVRRILILKSCISNAVRFDAVLYQVIWAPRCRDMGSIPFPFFFYVTVFGLQTIPLS